MSMTLVENIFVESSTVVAAKDQIGCSLGEEEIILDLASGVYYGLNNVGSRIWELIQKPITVGEIVDIVLSEYDAEPAGCVNDISRFLAEMAEHGLLEQNS
jgi:phage baseplate assembly protein W